MNGLRLSRRKQADSASDLIPRSFSDPMLAEVFMTILVIHNDHVSYTSNSYGSWTCKTCDRD